MERLGETGALEIEQQRICAKYGAPFVAVLPEQIIGISDTALSAIQPISGLRHQPENGDCGWYVWGGAGFSSEGDFFQPIHAEHNVEHLAQILPLLGLAPGWRFLIDQNGYQDIWFDDQLV